MNRSSGPLDKEQELKLIEEFNAGDESVFDQLVLLYSPRLFRVAYGLLGNTQDAEEVVQDAFVRAHKALKNFRGDASFETWMHRITVNLARNRFHWNRRRGSGVNISLSSPINPDQPKSPLRNLDLPDAGHQPDQLLEQEEIGWNIFDAIRHLPEPHREVMILRHIENMSYEEIAELLDCKVGTVKSRLARGRNLIKAYIHQLDAVPSQSPSRRKTAIKMLWLNGKTSES